MNRREFLKVAALVPVATLAGHEQGFVTHVTFEATGEVFRIESLISPYAYGVLRREPLTFPLHWAKDE